MRPPRTPPQLHTWPMSDGYQIRGRLWPGAGNQRSPAFLYLHGIQSHGGWFEWSAAELAATGQPVLLPDRRGSGLNTAARGDTPSGERWLQDLDELATWTTEELGVRRFAVVGVSWGGKLAAAWALRQPQRVDRLLLVAPGLFPAVDLPVWQKLRVAVSPLGGGGRLLDIPLNDPALFTDDPAGRKFIAEDPLKLTRVTARFLWASCWLDRRLRGLRQAGVPVPITMILAGRDRIIRNTPTIAWVRRVAAKPANITTSPEAAHTLEFEPDQSRYAELLASWAGGPEK